MASANFQVTGFRGGVKVARDWNWEGIRDKVGVKYQEVRVCVLGGVVGMRLQEESEEFKQGSWHDESFSEKKQKKSEEKCE